VSEAALSDGTFTHAVNRPVEELYDSISYFNKVIPSPAVKRISLPVEEAEDDRYVLDGMEMRTGKFVSVVPETGLTLV
jgi:hypothetical protein